LQTHAADPPFARGQLEDHACLAELHRNPALCRLLGIAAEEDIPNGWDLSRFLGVLGQGPHLTALRGVSDHLARRLGLAVPDLGRHGVRDAAGAGPALGGDAGADPARAGGRGAPPARAGPGGA
jgi:hypothetical protein